MGAAARIAAAQIAPSYRPSRTGIPAELCRGDRLTDHETDHREASSSKILLANFFLSDFGIAPSRFSIIIFFLTSLFIDSIHSTSCNKRPLQIFHEEWKGE
jgi:hypothetical protein